MSDVAYQPTEEQRRTVRAMAGFGLPEANIAALLEIGTETLKTSFHWDLERGAAEGTARVAQTLFQLATVDKNVAAVIFWMKARLGWREKMSVEQLGADGRAVDPGDRRVEFVLTIEK